MRRIQSKDPDEVMPPPTHGKPLTDKEQRILRQWIQEGAQWQKHWAFLTPVRPSLPLSQRAQSWARNPIDFFVDRKLARAGLRPNPPEKRAVLARRVALDLTGLPPSDQLLQAYMSDRRPGAYRRYVERLLASPSYGEHRARFWLDAARYGDTHGMHVDNYREIWPYRDWVVRAFNSNRPFNQFVVEQLAGDLLPNPTIDQRIATGFSRCNITTSEGGAIPEELNVRYMVDRVETTATVFLGLTAGCAVCHDHKYDPIQQREFYQLGAFFNNTTQPAMDGNQKDTPPVVALPSEENLPEWKSLKKLRKELRAKLVTVPNGTSRWYQTRPSISFTTDDLLLDYPMTQAESKGLKLPKQATWATGHPGGQRGVRFAQKGGLKSKLPATRTDEPLSISFWFSYAGCRGWNDVTGLHVQNQNEQDHWMETEQQYSRRFEL